MGMMMMTATALRKSRGLIQLMGQYDIQFADDDDGDDGQKKIKSKSFFNFLSRVEYLWVSNFRLGAVRKFV